MIYPKVTEKLVVKTRDNLYLFIDSEKPSWFFGKKDALRVIKKCNGRNSIEDIVKQLSEETGEPKEKLEKEVSIFINNIDRIGFIEKDETKMPTPPKFHFNFLLLHITHRCNLRCTYCYVNAGSALKNELTTTEIFNIVDQMKQLRKGKQSLTFSGGEPLLRKDIWTLAKYIKEKDIKLGIISNGTLINKEIARKITQNFDGILLSLDGPKSINDYLRGKGTFDLVIHAIENLIEAGMTPDIATTVTRKNINKIVDLIDTLKKYNIRRFGISPLVPTGRALEKNVPTLEQFTRLTRELSEKRKEVSFEIENPFGTESFLEKVLKLTRRDYSCGAGISTLSIDSDGSVYPCTTCMHFCKLGNIREQSLEEIWEESKILKDWRESTVDKIPKCSKCEWKRLCGGGCKVSAYLRYGTINAPDSYCEAFKTLFEDSLWQYAQTAHWTK